MLPSALPLVRFHLRVGARLALRVLAPVVAFACGAAGFFEKDFLRNLAATLFTGGSSGLLVAAAALGVAATAAPRVCRGLAGWVRHLPASGVAHRRAATLAVAVAQFPFFAGLAGLASLAVRDAGGLATAILGLAGTTLAAAVGTVPARRPFLTRLLALPAAALTASGHGAWIAAGFVLLLAADAIAGPLGRTAGAHPPRPRRESSARLFEARIAWRALGWKLGEAYVAGLLPVGAAALFVANNRAELPLRHVLLAAILGGAVGLVLFLAETGEALAARRPAWPWLRSLPGSAAERVRLDALFLGLHALPLLAVAAWIDPRAALPLAGALPCLAALTAGALRRAPERRTGAAGEILLQGGFAAALLALLPWLALPLLALTFPVLAAAAARERRQKVSRWLELHHLAAGDPQSWSAS
ncbi:MAG TPA: hypothetical protein VGR07_05030 [Thermoanaerobaculia bacterium]|jgi:hypothetical protein|nr:hypothetical protein [Thermoanaerobaculia bacterium]